MPDHIHLLLTPAADLSLEKLMQFIKGGFSFRLKSKLDVWEKGFNNHRIRDPADYDEHARYIEQNPVRAGLSLLPLWFPYSSRALPASIDPPLFQTPN